MPFTISILLLISHQYELDLTLAFLEQYETTPRTLCIRDPFVRKLLLERTIWVILPVTALVIALCLDITHLQAQSLPRISGLWFGGYSYCDVITN